MLKNAVRAVVLFGLLCSTRVVLAVAPLMAAPPPISPAAPLTCSAEDFATLTKNAAEATAAAAELRGVVTSYENERKSYNATVDALRSAVGVAILTALGAIGGWVVTTMNARADRDLKRLSVLEKANELRAAGVAIPSDIQVRYKVHGES